MARSGQAAGFAVLAVMVGAILLMTGCLYNPLHSRETSGTGSALTAATTDRPPGQPSPSATRPPTPTASTSGQTSGQASSQTSGQTSNTGLDLPDQEILDYFADIALKREYGSGDFDGVVCRWEQPVKVVISGSYTAEDYAWLIRHIDWLNGLDGLPPITVVTGPGNYHVTFARLEQLGDLIPGYVEGNWGFITINWNASGQISQGHMGVASDVTTQTQRNHLIMEEFTQGLGLLNDSPLYPDSIFQIKWTETQSLSALDELIIRMLYSPAIEAGMKENVLENLAAWLAGH